MAVFSGSVFSKELQMDTHLVVILPQETDGKPLKSLYLLHGFSDDCTSWQRKTRIEQYAQEKKIAVICPEVAHSFYLDMKYGQKYSTFVQKELVEICEKMFNLSRKSSDRYIAGLSMGGYGAMRTCLLDPSRYAGCGCFSGVLDIRQMVGNLGDRADEWKSLLGEEMTVSDDQDIYCLLDRLKKKKVRTKFYVACGTQDFLYGQFQEWKKRIGSYPVQVINQQWKGTHEWGFWDQCIKKYLDLVVE